MNRYLSKATAFLAVPIMLAAFSPGALAEPFVEEEVSMLSQDSFDDSFLSDRSPSDDSLLAQAGGSRGGGQREAAMQRLGITPELMQRIKAIQQQGKNESAGLMQQLKSKRQAFMQYMQSPDANEARARAMADEMQRIQGQISDLRLRTFFRMRDEMTPEQFHAFLKMRQRAGGRAGMKPGGGGQGGFGGRFRRPGGRQ